MFSLRARGRTKWAGRYRSNRKLGAAGIVAGLLLPLVGAANVKVGPFIFQDRAFADAATQIGSGTVRIRGASDLDGALAGYSPTSGLTNIGSNGRANHFQLDFLDVAAANGDGPDLVFFDARFGADPYEIAVRPAGGAFSSFVGFTADEFVDTGDSGPLGSTLFGLPIEFDLYGLPADAVVDAIQFRALPDALSMTQGDPVMAAALHVVPEPTTALLVGTGLAALAARRKARSTSEPRRGSAQR